MQCPPSVPQILWRPAFRQNSWIRLTLLIACAQAAWGCASAPPQSPVPCSRVALDPAPPWTASAAWNAGEDELVLIDPGSRGLASYGRDGHRQREIPLELAELDFGEPMRFERTEDGYVLVGKTQILQLADDLSLRARQRPFEPLKTSGLIDGSLNDAVLHDGVLHGYADFIDANTKPGEDDTRPDLGDDGMWRRGFVRLDPASGDLDMLHELPIGNDGGSGEYASYYLYDRRPYVARLGERVYVLRFTEPWSVHLMTRRGLRRIAAGNPGDDAEAHALQAWNGRLYVLTSRIMAEPEAESSRQQATPALPAASIAQIELLQAKKVVAKGHRRWALQEIAPRGGISRHLPLPSSAERLRLIPGDAFWTAIEETTSPNLGGSGDRTTFLYLPSTEIVAGSFTCAAAPRSKPAA